MIEQTLKAPFPWFGGKSRAASLVWERFGAVQNYVEPFFGSGAVLLARPSVAGRTRETVNDYSRFLANFWRALALDPQGVARHCDYPVSEVDLTSRHKWLVTRGVAILDALDMDCDPLAFDARIAGWWVWGLCQWIGSGWCPGDGRTVPGRISEQLPEVDGAKHGRGVHRAQCPDISSVQHGRGVHGLPRVAEQIPHLSSSGCGGHRNLSVTEHRKGLDTWFAHMSQRLRHVRVVCGDWSRVCTNSALDCKGRVLTGVFFDPPYDDHGVVYRQGGATDGEQGQTVGQRVSAWCLANGDNPKMRIALCGYEGEHDHLEDAGWSVVAWKAAGGYARGSLLNDNANRERVWFSPHCLGAAQPGLFDALGGAA